MRRSKRTWLASTVFVVVGAPGTAFNSRRMIKVGDVVKGWGKIALTDAACHLVVLGMLLLMAASRWVATLTC